MGFELLKKTWTKMKNFFSFPNDCHINETNTQSKSIKKKNEKNSKFIIRRVANRLTNDFFLSKDYKNFIMFLFYFFGETTLL